MPIRSNDFLSFCFSHVFLESFVCDSIFSLVFCLWCNVPSHWLHFCNKILNKNKQIWCELVLLKKHKDLLSKLSSRMALGPILGLPSTSLGLFLANFGGPFGSVSSPVCAGRSPWVQKLLFWSCNRSATKTNCELIWVSSATISCFWDSFRRRSSLLHFCSILQPRRMKIRSLWLRNLFKDIGIQRRLVAKLCSTTSVLPRRLGEAPYNIWVWRYRETSSMIWFVYVCS